MQNSLKKIENVGWAKMSKMLDKEMPLEEKKRRFFLWNISALVFLGLAFTSIWFFYQITYQSNVTAKNEQAVLTSSILPTSTIVSEAGSSNSTILQNASSINEQNSDKSPIPQFFKKPNTVYSKTTKNIHSRINKPTTDDAILQVVSITNNDLNTSSHIASQTMVSSSKMIDLPNQTGLVHLENNVEKVNSATVLEPLSDQYNFTTPLKSWIGRNINDGIPNLNFIINDAMPLIVKSSLKPFSIEVGMGLKMMLSQSNAMPIGGLGLNYRFHKWQVSTGAYYSFTTIGSDSLSIASNYYSEYENIFNKNLGTNVIQKENATIQGITLFDQKTLHLPLTVEYNLSKYFSLKGGIYFDKITSSRSSYATTDQKGSSPVPNTVEETLSITESKVITHNYNWIAGISYMPHQRLKISLDLLGNDKFIAGNSAINAINSSVPQSNNTQPYLQLMAKYRFLSF